VTVKVLRPGDRGARITRRKRFPDRHEVFTGCGVAFYDRSKNNSRVWQDVSSCGRPANVRAYRDRLRQTRQTRRPAGSGHPGHPVRCRVGQADSLARKTAGVCGTLIDLTLPIDNRTSPGPGTDSSARPRAWLRYVRCGSLVAALASSSTAYSGRTRHVRRGSGFRGRPPTLPVLSAHECGDDDTVITGLTVATGCNQLKRGAPAGRRAGREIRWLVEIEAERGDLPSGRPSSELAPS
jgi:hypothetical protein